MAAVQVLVRAVAVVDFAVNLEWDFSTKVPSAATVRAKVAAVEPVKLKWFRQVVRTGSGPLEVAYRVQ